MKFSKKNLLAALALTAVGFAAVGLSAGQVDAKAESVTVDPTMRMINGSTGVKDTAYFNEEGETVLQVQASPGYGTRSNMSQLEGYGLVDVKEFSTTVSFSSVSVGISTIFSLQTVETGTIGAGNGNGVHLLLRKDTDSTLTVAAYDQTGGVTYYARENALTFDSTADVAIEWSYETGEIALASGDTSVSITSSVASAIDSHYADNDYKGYWSLSSYYMGVSPQTAKCEYIIREINGLTPRAFHTAAVEKAVSALEAGYASLDENSSAEEIGQVSALNVFKTGSSFETLLGIADDAAGLMTRIQTVKQGLSVYEQRVVYDEIDAQFDAFIAALNEYNVNSAVSVRNAREAYEAIELDKIEALPTLYKERLVEKFGQVKAMENFSVFIVNEVDNFFAAYEEKIEGEDVTSLADYQAITSVSDAWEEFKDENGLAELVSADVLAEMEGRADALKAVLENSFYTRFWTEGDSWVAELTEQGIYATGAGTYGETLGFNKKLTVGQNAKIDFNIIYALKTLGANHLHIGFYPMTNTGTLGVSDGVRVDFWFAGNTVEIKPVNGATETEIFSQGILAIEDTGYFDPFEGDYSQGKYTVELDKDGNTLLVRVNGLEMELDGLNADLFANGCYITVSAMSVKGADQNEIMITNVGGVNYINYDPESEKVPQNGGSNANGNGGENAEKDGGCGSVVGIAAASVVALAAGALVVRRKKENE
ncbi:MAG: hypothetical protein IJF44_05990 [Clostridia bacterium]|nr:hypothetical protein [Clostridia bacterium]